jgi:hypothetical protein
VAGYESKVWLLKNMTNPFPVAARLTVSDSRQVELVLAPDAKDAFVGWVEEALAIDDLKGRVERGDRIELVNAPLSDLKIEWPKSGAGSQVVLTGSSGKAWRASLSYPSSGGVMGIVNLFSGRKEGKALKEALTA